MKKRMIASVFAVFMFMFAGQAFSAEILQIWSCEVNEGHTPAEVMKLSKDWLDAAKDMQGGENIAVYVDFPVASAGTLGSFNFVLSVPDLATWGSFTDNYSDSAAAEIDVKFFEAAMCDTSSLWESTQME